MPKPSEFARLMQDIAEPRDFTREALIEDKFNLNREIGWAGFRREFFETAAIR